MSICEILWSCDRLAILLSDSQRELHQSGAAVFHLLSRHIRNRRRSHAGMQWTILRQGGAHAETEASEHEQTAQKQRYRVQHGSSLHLRVFLSASCT